jgi:hypothetical protein
LQLLVLDLLDENVGLLSLHGAAHRQAGSQNLADGSGELARLRALAHFARHVVHVLERDVAVVLDVLHLLAIARRLGQRLENERGGRGNDLNGRVAVLNDQLHSHAQTLPVLRSCRQPTNQQTETKKEKKREKKKKKKKIANLPG